jgi:hypothetical protein
VTKKSTALAATAVTAAALALAVPTGSALADPTPGCATAPTVASAAPDPAYTHLFNGYSDSGKGWTGADSTYSVRIPGGRDVWLFSDTLLGPVNPDGTRPKTAPFINNSFVVQRGSQLTTVHGGTADNPQANADPPGDNTQNWWWSGDGVVGGDGTLQVVYLQFSRFGPGIWDWGWSRNVLARYDLRDLHLIDTRDLPSSAKVDWGSFLRRDGAYTYVYGVEDLGADKYSHIARVRGAGLTGAWEYWTGSGWSRTESDSARVMVGVANEYSVTRWHGRYLLVTQDTTELFSTKIVAYSSCSPTGPFTNKTVLYTTPETGAAGSYHNPNIYTYNAHVHPELSHGNTLLITYNVNDFVSDELYGDVSIYRPRFVDVTLHEPAR